MKSKTAKGTKDYTPVEEETRQELIKECENVFKLYDAKRIDTPTIELLSILLAKYNNDENAKEIYVLKNKKEDGEETGLRYDLTVPFSRYVSDNGIEKMRKYQIGKVFRRDKPSPGRYREFYQCDYDFLGNCNTFFVDIETIIMMNNILKNIKIKFNTYDYVIKLNSKKLLFEIFEKCKIEEKSYNTICSLLDKLDKVEWKNIYGDLLKEIEDVEKLEMLKNYLSNKENYEKLESYPQMKNMIGALNELSPDIPLKLELTLARGLNYYSGIIFEAIFINGDKTVSSSIAGGGRYDELCKIPCVGFSIGIDRILSFIEQAPKNSTKIWIIPIMEKDDEINNKISLYRLKILTYLREKNISCGTDMGNKIQMKKSMAYVLKNSIPYVVFIGREEMEKSTIKLKVISQKLEMEITKEEIFEKIKL